MKIRQLENSLSESTSILWTVKDAALYLRLNPETVRTMVRRGELPAQRLGRQIRFQPEKLKEWVLLHKVSNESFE
jgi:excisionase family DNA binding protein